MALNLENGRHALGALAVPGYGKRNRRLLRGFLRTLRRFAPLLAGAFARVDVGAQPPIGGVPECSVARDLHVLDLADQLGHAPPRRLIDTRHRGERRCRRLVLLQLREEILERWLVETGPDVADGLELSVAVYAEQQRTERARTPALPGSPSADDAVHGPERLRLHPRRR